MANEAGKGSALRPTQVSQEVADANWERIWGKKKEDPNYGLDFSKINESGVKLPSITIPMNG